VEKIVALPVRVNSSSDVDSQEEGRRSGGALEPASYLARSGRPSLPMKVKKKRKKRNLAMK
jgi:hypothetical protein